MAKNFNRENGTALIFTILVLFILSVMGGVLISISMSSFSMVRHSKDYDTAYHIADGAADEVLGEVAILTDNAEFAALSSISTYAESIRTTYVTENEVVGDDGEEITEYEYDESAFESDLAAKYDTYYKNDLIASFKNAVETVSFAPDFEDNFQEDISSSVSMTSPTVLTSEYITDQFTVDIEISGYYNNIQRKIKLVLTIDKPAYIFDSAGIGENLYMIDYSRTDQNPAFRLESWKEININ